MDRVTHTRTTNIDLGGKDNPLSTLYLVALLAFMYVHEQFASDGSFEMFLQVYTIISMALSIFMPFAGYFIRAIVVLQILGLVLNVSVAVFMFDSNQFTQDSMYVYRLILGIYSMYEAAYQITAILLSWLICN